MGKIYRRVLFWFGIRRDLDDLNEEIEFHREMKQRSLESTGLSPEEAYRAASRELGNSQLAREDARRVWVWSWLDEAWQDCRYAARTLRRSPSFTTVAVLSLALGIGGTTAVFTLISVLAFTPLPSGPWRTSRMRWLSSRSIDSRRISSPLSLNTTRCRWPVPGMRPSVIAPTNTFDNVEALAPAAVAAIQDIDPGVPVPEVRLLADMFRDTIARDRLNAVPSAAFALTALSLAASGVYCLLSYQVAERTREIGIRTALGARTSEVSGMVVGNSLRLILTGLALGLAGTLALTRLFEGLLYGVPARDPTTLAGVVAVTVAVGVIAAFVPARRAARVDPLTALRQE